MNEWGVKPMSKETAAKLWWKCPKCGETVSFTNEILGTLFDEDTGEAFFDTTEEGGVLFHTVFCTHCGATWTITISGLETEFMKQETNN